jgi:DNA-binding response OmpR family regulator
VLVAEDELLVARMLDKYLRAAELQVTLVLTGVEAWGVLSSELPPLVAVMDWSIPGISGLELCRKARERQDAPFTYLILLTGRSREVDRAAAIEAGADQFIPKPFNVQHVVAQVQHGILVASERRSR